MRSNHFQPMAEAEFLTLYNLYTEKDDAFSTITPILEPAFSIPKITRA